MTVSVLLFWFVNLCCYQLVENDKIRNGNREALTALRKQARTTKTSVPSPFEVIMKEVEGSSGKQLIKEICPTCGDHDPKEHTWLMFPGSDIFARVPFHVAHTVVEKGMLQNLVHDNQFIRNYYWCRVGPIDTWRKPLLSILKLNSVRSCFGCNSCISFVQ